MQIDNISNKFKETAELQEFCTSQQSLIIELSKKIKSLEDERNHLKTMLDSSIPIYTSITISDEENISREQLSKLKTISSERELTLEETKKVDIFTKILISLSALNKDIDTSAKNMDSAELLQLMNKND